MRYRGYDVEKNGNSQKIKRNGHLVISLDECDYKAAQFWIDKHKAALANEKDRKRASDR